MQSDSVEYILFLRDQGVEVEPIGTAKAYFDELAQAEADVRELEAREAAEEAERVGRTRVSVEQPADVGPKPLVLHEPWVPAGPDDWKTKRPSILNPAAVKKVLRLSAICDDHTIRAKYRFSRREYLAIDAQRRTSAHAAAALAKSYLDAKGFTGVSVDVDTVRTEKATSSQEIRDYCDQFPVTPGTIPMEALPPNYQQIVMLPRPGDEDTESWEMAFPLQAFGLATRVWQALQHRSVDDVLQSIGEAMMSLGIHVSVAGNYPLGETRYHVGEMTVASLVRAGLQPAVDDTFLAYRDLVQPFFAFDDVAAGPVASAVALGNGSWLVNDHVRRDSAAKLVFRGGRVIDYGFVRANTTLWVMTGVQAVGGLANSGVMMRTPANGERVRYVTVLDGTVWVGPPVHLQFAGDYTYVRSDNHSFDPNPGMSGGLYVAEEDGMAVAMHEGRVMTEGILAVRFVRQEIVARAAAIEARRVTTYSHEARPQVWTRDVARMRSNVQIRDRLNRLFGSVEYDPELQTTVSLRGGVDRKSVV